MVNMHAGSEWGRFPGKHAEWDSTTLFSLTIVIIWEVRIWMMQSLESLMRRISTCRNQLQRVFDVGYAFWSGKRFFFFILAKKIKTKAIVSHCQQTQRRGTLKCQSLFLLCKHRTGATRRPLVVSPSKWSLRLTVLIRKRSSQNKDKIDGIYWKKMMFLIPTFFKCKQFK